MYFEKAEEVVELTQKEKDLFAIDARIRGLNGTITRYEDDTAYEAHIKELGQLFSSRGAIYPINYGAINRELDRMEMARKDVMKRPN